MIARLWRRHGLVGILLVSVLALALVLRLKGIAWGLPFSFVNADESTVVPKAFRVAQGRLNPEFFFYPSLYFYLVGAVYVIVTPAWWVLHDANLLARATFVVDPGPYYLLGRLVSVAMGTVSVYLVYRLGRAVFGRAAGLLAALCLAVVPLHVAYSHMAVTDVTATAFSLLALVLLERAADLGGRRWLLLGAAAAGLATSTKYNLGMLILPATIAAVYACRGEVRERVAAGARAAGVWTRLLVARVYAPMLLAFVVASPFVILDAPHFVRDFVHQNEIMDRGWLGFENVGNGFWYNLAANLGGSLGIVLLVLALVGVGWSLWRRTRLDLLLAPYVAVYFVYISTWKALPDRYLLPVVPLLLLLAARGCVELVRARPRLRYAMVPAAVVVLALALAPPFTKSVAYDQALSGLDVRVRAKAWVETHIAPGSRIAIESYGPPLVAMRDRRYYRTSGEQTPPAYRLVRLRLPLPGVFAKDRSIRALRRQRVEYVVVSSTVYDRVFAATDRYPRIAAFYRRLDKLGRLVKVFEPKASERGPVVKVYRL